MKDLHDRPIDYMRLSVTDRCNLRCFYCSPGREFRFLPAEEILSYEEFLRLARLALEIGVTKFRITGGEPLVRKGLAGFIRSLVELKGAEDIALTTNGILLMEHLDELREAGLRRINISLDRLDPATYARDHRRGTAGLGPGRDRRRARQKGFSPVKINVVLLKGKNDDLSPFVDLAPEKPVHVRFIELMDFSPARAISSPAGTPGPGWRVRPAGGGPRARRRRARPVFHASRDEGELRVHQSLFRPFLRLVQPAQDIGRRAASCPACSPSGRWTSKSS